MQNRATEAAARLLWPLGELGLAKRLRRITCPVKLVWGQRGPRGPAELREEVRVGLAGKTETVVDAGRGARAGLRRAGGSPLRLTRLKTRLTVNHFTGRLLPRAVSSAKVVIHAARLRACFQLSRWQFRYPGSRSRHGPDGRGLHASKRPEEVELPQMVHFRAFDRLAGGEGGCRGKLIVARDDQRLGHLKVYEPPEVRGTNFLPSNLRAGSRRAGSTCRPNESPDASHRRHRRRGVCGSDVSYEDLERWQRLDRPEKVGSSGPTRGRWSARLRPEAKPLEAAQSRYTKVVSYATRGPASPSSQSRSRAAPSRARWRPPWLRRWTVMQPSELRVEDLRDGRTRSSRSTTSVADGKIRPASPEKGELPRRCRQRESAPKQPSPGEPQRLLELRRRAFSPLGREARLPIGELRRGRCR